MKRTGSLAAALSKYKDMNASVRVGVLENATYPDGTPVAMVAFWNEYGTKTSPVRAFFRTTVSEQKKNWVLSVQNLMKMHNNPQQVMGLIGEHMKGNIVQGLVSFSDPKNADSTERAKGFNNPLIDKDVATEWNIQKSWKLISEMPFGNPLSEPDEKEFSPIEDRVKVFR